MATETEIVHQTNGAALAERPLQPADLVQQVALIQQVMKAVMRDGEHYGKIPGCGDKPTLLKPGAEKLGMTFRLAPRFSGEREPVQLGNGHREYVILCELYTIGSNRFVGAGLGSCSTMEGKYRYRTGPNKPTGKPVPKEYWNLRKTEPGKAQELLGGKGYGVGKDDAGTWQICEQAEKVDHDNPADYYNTVLKMAKKRSHVDAILMATAASDIFTQDVEDLPEVRPPQTAANWGATAKGNGADKPASGSTVQDASVHPVVSGFMKLFNSITDKWPERGGDNLLERYLPLKRGGHATIPQVLKFHTAKEMQWLEQAIREIGENFDLAQLESPPTEPNDLVVDGETEPVTWG